MRHVSNCSNIIHFINLQTVTSGSNYQHLLVHLHSLGVASQQYHCQSILMISATLLTNKAINTVN